MFYSVVLLDGNELHCLSLDQVQELFFKRQLNQNSLICNAEDGKWQMLKRTFDLSQWIPNTTAGAPVEQNNYQPSVNPFEQTAPVVQPHAFQHNPFNQPAPTDDFQSASSGFQSPETQNQPVAFNQFPPNQSNQSNPFGQHASGGYSQNNQTETYYQAETNQTNYNFQNNQAGFAPSKYDNAANSYQYSPGFAPNSNFSGRGRNGLRAASVFLFGNVVFYSAFLIFGLFFDDPAASADKSQAYQTGRKFGMLLPLLINLLYAFKLWNVETGESARKSVLFLGYFGFIVYGIIFSLFLAQSGSLMMTAFTFVTAFLYFLSLALVLHGKESPSPARVAVGSATYAIYFLIIFGTLSLGFVGMLMPKMAKLAQPNRQFDQYKIEGRDFQDKTTGAKIVLPDGWSMVSTDNPHIRTPESRMIAVDQSGNSLALLEIVPVPASLDMKRQNSSMILDQLSDNMVNILNEQVRKSGGLASKDDFKEITRLSIFIGKHPAKLLVFDKTEQGEKLKGHLIITYDELSFYVLHSWCPAGEYEQKQNDFTFFEKNFSVPEKINSTFTQTAETEKKR